MLPSSHGSPQTGVTVARLYTTASRRYPADSLRRERTRSTMDDYVDETMLELDRFAIGQPVPRSEDPVLLRGEGHYADDINLPGQAYAVMVRSSHGHGVIRQ